MTALCEDTTRDGSLSTVAALLNSITPANENSVFGQIATSCTVPKIGVEVYGWMQSAVKVEWDMDSHTAASPFPVIPSAIATKMDCLLRFFHYLWQSNKGRQTFRLDSTNSQFIADQLLLRLIDQTFATCRISQRNCAAGVSFLPASLGHQAVQRGIVNTALSSTGGMELTRTLMIQDAGNRAENVDADLTEIERSRPPYVNTELQKGKIVVVMVQLQTKIIIEMVGVMYLCRIVLLLFSNYPYNLSMYFLFTL